MTKPTRDPLRAPGRSANLVIDTRRLRLAPIDYPLAARVLAGDLTGLLCAPGWPTVDTPDALGAFVEHGDPSAFAGWLITRRGDGAVVGDCGWRGGPDVNGDVEIGYGLARPSRGQGIGTEAVGALVEWVIAQRNVRRVVAEVLVGNTPSRRLLERLGFTWTHDVPPYVWYALPSEAS